MTSKSKAKGNSWEREVAKFLTKTYNSPFHRIVNSGAYVGGSNFFRKDELDLHQGKSFKGDINAPDTWRFFNCEAKSYADFAFHQLFTRCNQLEVWINQLMTVADPSDVNILFLKFNRKGQYVGVQDVGRWNKSSNHSVYKSESWGDWILVDFGAFFSLNQEILERLACDGV